MASWWCSTSSSASISCRYSVNCRASSSHNRPLPHTSAFRPSSTSRGVPIAFYKKYPINKRNSSGFGRLVVSCTTRGTEVERKDSPASPSEMDCVGTGQDVECLVAPEEENKTSAAAAEESLGASLEELWELAVLVSPFFFWGTAMVAMKEVLPKSGPFFVSAFRLIPAGFLLVAFAASRGRPFPSGFNAWLSISLFAVVDAAFFQVCAVLFILIFTDVISFAVCLTVKLNGY